MVIKAGDVSEEIWGDYNDDMMIMMNPRLKFYRECVGSLLFLAPTLRPMVNSELSFSGDLDRSPCLVYNYGNQS